MRRGGRERERRGKGRERKVEEGRYNIERRREKGEGRRDNIEILILADKSFAFCLHLNIISK